MQTRIKTEAEDFINNEKQFQLGMLPTEQSNPATRGIDKIFAKDVEAGIKTLLSVDREVVKMAEKIFAGAEYLKLKKTALEVLKNGGRIIFSGCGATGRLSILLESIWRRFFVELKETDSESYQKMSRFENQIFSIMTGGDYALIRSVESFEDYQEFGRQQVRELEIGNSDMLVAITEGGETSSVLGTIAECLNRGAETFLMFNNPADILCQYIERSREAIQNPKVTVLDLYCGPMAIAGSTRMQATTSEQLIGGGLLEDIMLELMTENLPVETLKQTGFEKQDYAKEFGKLLDDLLSDANLNAMADLINFEAEIYRKEGLITYLADDYLLDILTDTTERAPTFMLPPFKKCDDKKSPSSWAFVKNPGYTTADAWLKVFCRKPRCLDWNQNRYAQLNAPEKIKNNPPLLDANELFKFQIGNENDPFRLEKECNAAVAVLTGSETIKKSYDKFNSDFERYSQPFATRKRLIIGKSSQAEKADFFIDCDTGSSPLKLMDHMAIKLVLNTISTSTMILLGRVESNWMSWVEVSNKKLRDRGIRLISEICGLNYKDACYALHETIIEMEKIDFSDKAKPSPVQETIKKFKNK